MTRNRIILLVGIILLWLVLAGGAAWWYLMGPNEMSAAEMLPKDTLILVEIPNATLVGTGYESSQIKKLVEDPNVKPLIDMVQKQIGDKGMDVIDAFLPNLSGQSFIALTHLDPTKPMETGFIAAMHPKPGLGNFDDFVAKLNATWPDVVKQAKTGKDSVDGVDYQWIQYPGDPNKVCVAQYHGWVVTTWGAAPLQDWIERVQKKSSTPSLATSDDYKKSLTRIGKDPMFVVYFYTPPFMNMLFDYMLKQDPTSAQQVTYMKSKLSLLGGIAMGTTFNADGEIVDRISSLLPNAADFGDAGVTPCAFDTLKFTGPTTLMYTGSSVNWPKYWHDFQEQMGTTGPNGMVIQMLQNGAKAIGLDIQHNIVDALGTNSELSVQMEWNPETLYPEVGAFIKVEKPDDFQTTIKAVIDAVRKATATTAVINEIKDPSGQNFVSLKFVQAVPVTPTMTENGPYFGVFLSENQAVRSYNRKETDNLIHNADLIRQMGDQRNVATQMVFLDTPKLLNHTYKTVTPYLSLASMFSPQIGAMLKGKTLPENLDWLAPVGTWSLYSTVDADGMKVYSVSGIGNQYITIFGGVVTTSMLVAYEQMRAVNSQFTPIPPGPDDTTTPTPPLTVPSGPDDTTTPAQPPTDVVIPPTLAPTPTAPNTTTPPDTTTPPPATPPPAAPAPEPPATPAPVPPT